MKKVLLLSPHFDDAVLSAGQFLAGRPDADVITVFGGFPDTEQETPYDIKCGFKNSTDAVSARRTEDDEALALLGATPIYWSFPDGQYNEEVTDEEIGKSLIRQLQRYDYEFLLVPLGLGHPDHIRIAEVVYELKRKKKISIETYYWEDLPLRVVEPELVQPRLERYGLTERVSIGDGSIAKKIRSLSCYKSQIGTGILDPYLMYVPERFWQ